jgi:hypothetical protein
VRTLQRTLAQAKAVRTLQGLLLVVAPAAVRQATAARMVPAPAEMVPSAER